METIILIITIIMFIIGIIGTIPPALPGVILIFGGMVLYGFATGFESLGTWYYNIRSIRNYNRPICRISISRDDTWKRNKTSSACRIWSPSRSNGFQASSRNCNDCVFLYSYLIICVLYMSFLCEHF